MATSGDEYRSSYRGGHWSAAGLALVCLVAASCQFASPSFGASERVAQTKPASSKRIWCEAKPNTAWKRILNGRVVPLSRHASIGPLTLAKDGRSFFAEIYSKTYSGVVRIDARNGRNTKIMRFRDPVNYQARGDFDGRWLVWAEYHSLYDNLADFTVWSWDSRTGRLRQIGSATRSPSGKFWPSVWQAPVVHQGYAAWEQGAGEDGLGEIHVVNLRSGRDRIVRNGHPLGPFLIDGPRVVWPESMEPGALTVIKTADAKTGRMVVTPPALRNVRGAIWPASNGKSLLYASDGQTSLWWSPSLGVAARRVFPGRDYQLLKIPLDEAWRRYTSFSVPYKTFLADVITGRYIRISPGGWAIVGPKALVLLTPSKEKANNVITDVVFLPLTSLPPIPPCE